MIDTRASVGFSECFPLLVLKVIFVIQWNLACGWADSLLHWYWLALFFFFLWSWWWSQWVASFLCGCFCFIGSIFLVCCFTFLCLVLILGFTFDWISPLRSWWKSPKYWSLVDQDWSYDDGGLFQCKHSGD